MDLLIGCGVLALVTVVGLVAHEWSHAFVLRLAAVDYTISYAPGREPGLLGLLRSCPWAVVHPHPTGNEPPWILRAAALAPLVLAVPALGLVATGDATSGSWLTTVGVVGWLACTIPSPQDFSVVFYAHTALADSRSSKYPSRADRVRR